MDRWGEYKMDKCFDAIDGLQEMMAHYNLEDFE